MDEIIEFDITNNEHLKFACSCGEDGKKKCEEVMEWATTYLKTDRAGLLNKAVYKLNWSYGASITGIPNDMWSAVITEEWWDDEDKAGTYIQCDDVLDGVAFTLRHYYNKYGDNKSRKDD